MKINWAIGIQFSNNSNTINQYKIMFTQYDVITFLLSGNETIFSATSKNKSNQIKMQPNYTTAGEWTEIRYVKSLVLE